jgi:GT2 family glycosyltransferase
MDPGVVNDSRLSIILVTWNSARYLPRCLAGVTAQTWPDAEIIVIDNASTDGSADVIRKLAPKARVIENRENRGFSAAVNQGIRAASGAYVLLCNPDAFLQPDYAQRLIEALEAAGDDFGMAGGTLYRGEGDDIRRTDVIDTKGIRMTRSGRHFDIGQETREGEDDRELEIPGIGYRVTVIGGQVPEDVRQPSDSATPQPGHPATEQPSNLATHQPSDPTTPQPRYPATPQASDPTTQQPNNPATQQLRECFGVSGAAPLYRRAMIDDVSAGGEFLDEDFFAYREDADVSWRAQLFGWRALHVPAAVGVHVRTVTPARRRQLSPTVNMHSVKNRFLLRLKNEGGGLVLRNGAFELGRDLLVLAAALTVERTSLPAFAWLWKNRRRIMAKRREIQRRRRVPDRALAKWFR